MSTKTHVYGAERMVTYAELTAQGLKVRFADDREGVIPWEDLQLPGRPKKIELPNSYVIELQMSDGRIEEIPWDFARHYVDPGYRARSERAAAEGRRIFGQRLRRLRQEKGLSQQELAAKSGISRVTIARIELGEQSPRYETIVALAKGLNIPIERLLLDEIS